MTEVVRKRLLLAMTVSALALAAMTWGAMASAQDATDTAAGGETAAGDEGVGNEGVGDEGTGEATGGGEDTGDNGWDGGDDLSLCEDYPGVREPSDSGEEVTEDTSVSVADGGADEPEIVAFELEVMAQSGQPEAQRDFTAGTPPAATRDGDAGGEGCGSANDAGACVAP